MGIPVMILGESGTGKSAALRNVLPESSMLIQTVKKPLPFRSTDWKLMNKSGGSVAVTDNWERIISGINNAVSLGKDKVFIDDFQYLLANEFMRRTAEKGFDKFTEIGHHAWSVMMAAQSAPDSLRVYFLCHTDEDERGHVRAKTIGKLLNDKITVEGLFTIVLRTLVTDQGYYFSTQNNGADTVKSPIGLFEESRIDNDLAAVDAAICDYYGIKSTQEKAA